MNDSESTVGLTQREVFAYHIAEALQNAANDAQFLLFVNASLTIARQKIPTNGRVSE